MLSYVVNYMPEAEGGATVVASHDLLVCIGVPLIGAHIRKAVAHHYIAITYSQAAMNSAADSDTMPEANSIADSNIRRYFPQRTEEWRGRHNNCQDDKLTAFKIV